MAGRTARLRLRTAAEQAGEETAAGGTLRQLILQLLDALLGLPQRLFLHHDGLGHVVRGCRLTGNALADECIRVAVNGSGLLFYLGKLPEQAFDSLTIVLVHDIGSPLLSDDYSRSPVKFSSSWKMLTKFR